MARKPKPRISREEQSKRFLEAAREAGVPDHVDLERIVRQIAKKPPAKAKKPKK